MELNDKSKSEYWQDLCHNEKLEKLLNEGYLADCKFVVGPNKTKTETIHAHKVMLTLESPVFEKLFEGNFSEGKNMPEVHIDDFHPKDFKNFCFLIYYHNAQPDIEQLFGKYHMQEITEICRLCHKYMVTSILKKCMQFFELNLLNLKFKIKEMILLYELAYKLNDNNLLTSVEKAIPIGLQFFDPIVYQLSLDIFYKYIDFLSKLQNQKPPAAQMFNYIEGYILKNNLEDKKKETPTKNKKEIEFYCLNNFLKFVNFKTMTAAEFKNGPGKSILLDWKIKYELLLQLIPQNTVSIGSYNYRQGRRF